MYLEINNIAQGINIGIFVLVLSTPGFYNFQTAYYSTPLFALASLFISVIFWARYYFDTELLDRSFTVFSAVWFFGYLIAQGISISMVAQPTSWLIGTAVFLFFGRRVLCPEFMGDSQKATSKNPVIVIQIYHLAVETHDRIAYPLYPMCCGEIYSSRSTIQRLFGFDLCLCRVDLATFRYA